MKISIAEENINFSIERWGIGEKIKEYMGSKLAYCELDGANNKDSSFWNIDFSGSTVKPDLKNKVLFLPSDISFPEFCYVIRAVFDVIAVMKGICPFHGGIISDRKHRIIIFAKSGEGKSFLADSICKKHHGFKICGDDHLYFGKNTITGNKFSRIRCGSLDKYVKLPCSISSTDNVFAVCTEICSENTICENKDIVPVLFRLSAFKYALSDFKICGKSYSTAKLFPFINIEEEYFMLTEAVIKRIVYIRGDKSFILKSVLDYADNLIGR